jgi:hypothetical protein
MSVVSGSGLGLLQGVVSVGGIGVKLLELGRERHTSMLYRVIGTWCNKIFWVIIRSKWSLNTQFV